MSKSTLRKRIALTATTALFAGMLTVVSTPVASALSAPSRIERQGDRRRGVGALEAPSAWFGVTSRLYSFGGRNGADRPTG